MYVVAGDRPTVAGEQWPPAASFTFNYLFIVKCVILPNYRMINYDSIFILSSGVTCNWCIQLDALQSLALNVHGASIR